MHQTPFHTALLLMLGLTLTVVGSGCQPSPDGQIAARDPKRMPQGSVFVLGGIHQSHEDARTYTYARMGELLEHLRPDVLCLEVQQRYLDDGSLKGMPFDFRKAMVPKARELGIPIVGIDWWDDQRGNQWQQLQQQAAADSALEAEVDLYGGMFELLRDYFRVRDFEQINSKAITDLWAAKNQLKYRTLDRYPKYAPIVEFETSRNNEMVKRISAVVEDSPNKRVLVGVGIDHKYFIEAELRKREIRVVPVDELMP